MNYHYSLRNNPEEGSSQIWTELPWEGQVAGSGESNDY
jgi:hypothetical protein